MTDGLPFDDPNELTSPQTEVSDRVGDRLSEPDMGADGLLDAAYCAERSGQLVQAIKLYEEALRADPGVPVARFALKRLYEQEQRWTSLVQLLVAEAQSASDKNVRALAFFRVGDITRFELQDSVRAAGYYEQALALTPTNRFVAERLVEVYSALGQLDALDGALARVASLSDEPRDRAAYYYEIGRTVAARSGDPMAGCAWYEKAFECDPTLPLLSRRLGDAAARAGRWDQLEAALHAQVRSCRDPQSEASAHVALGELLEGPLRSPVRAAQHYARALDAVPTYEAALCGLDRSHAVTHDLNSIVPRYQEAARVCGQDALAATYLFRAGLLCEEHSADFDRAIECYKQALDRDPANLSVVKALARTAERACRPLELLEALDAELSLSAGGPHAASLHVRAADILEHTLRDFAGATERLRHALTHEPTNLPALVSLTLISEQLGRWKDVVELYERILSLVDEPEERAALYYGLGCLCEARSIPGGDAVAYYRCALEAVSGHQPSLIALRRMIQDQGDWEELISLIASEIEHGPNDTRSAHLTYEVGQLLERRLQQRRDALAAYQRASGQQLSFAPAAEASSRLLFAEQAWTLLVDALDREAATYASAEAAAEALFRAGRICLDELGDGPRAIACFESAREHQPSHPGVRRFLRELGIWQPDEKASPHEGSSTDGGTDGLGVVSVEDGEWYERVQKAARSVAEAETPTDAARRQTRLARLLETRDEETAADAYRTAMALDAANHTAYRGYSRLALRLGAPELLKELAAEAERRGDWETARVALGQLSQRESDPSVDWRIASLAQRELSERAPALQRSPSGTPLKEET